MKPILRMRIFRDIGKDYVEQDLTEMLFKDIDFEREGVYPSFFRSDFSRSQFAGCTFFMNKFGRADLIDIYIENTRFYKVDFGSCLFKNATMKKTIFQENRYHGVAIQYCYFKNCTFQNEHFITNMFHCVFDQCNFFNCKFEKSSLESNQFTNCQFSEVDMAECIAENLWFSTCDLSNVCLNATMWSTCLYKDTDIRCISFKYHGEITDVLSSKLDKYTSQLLASRRLAEYLNTRIIAHTIGIQTDLPADLSLVLDIATTLQQSTREKNMLRILDMLQFYIGGKYIDFVEYTHLLSILQNNNWSKFSFDESLKYESKLFQIEKQHEKLSLNLSYICTIAPNQLCIASFRLPFDNSSDAQEYLNNLFQLTNQEYCMCLFRPPYFEVLSEATGSVILTIAASALLVVLLARAAKVVCHDALSIKIQHKTAEQIAKQLEATNCDLSSLKAICSIANKYGLLHTPSDDKQTLQELSSELTKGGILDVIINLLT